MFKKQLSALLFTLLLPAFALTAFIQPEQSAAATISENDQAEAQPIKKSRYMPGYNATSRATLTPENTRTILSTPTIETEEELYDFILNNARNYNTVFSAYYYGDTDTLLDDMDAILGTDDYVYGILTEIGYSEDDYFITFEISYATSAVQQKFVDREVKRIVSEIIEPDMTDVERVLAINNYIVRNTTYSFDSEASPHSAYAIVSEGLGVCQAYAMLAYQMYWAVGLEAHYVAGYAGEEHAWNLVKVDGQWYHIDSTWNDPEIEFMMDVSDYIDYSYFLVSEKTLLAEDREIEQRPSLPRATSERFALVRQAALSTEYTYDDIPFLLTPEFANGILYFVNSEEETFEINAINLNDKRLKVEPLIDIEAMEIFATESALYFTNVDNGFGLSKYVFDEDEIYDLYADEPVNEIRFKNGSVTAFSYGEPVYTDEGSLSNGGVTESVNELLSQIDRILNSIDYDHPDFKELAENLFYYVDEIPYHLEDVLSGEAIALINNIREHYNSLQDSSYSGYNRWDDMTTLDPEKIWSIQLSREIANSRANLQKIKLLDEDGDELEATIQIRGATIFIEYDYLYDYNVYYSIVIEEGLVSTSGKKLRNGWFMQFYVEE